MTSKPLAGRGGPGRGGGRKLEPGVKAITKTVTMDPADIDLLVELGEWNLGSSLVFQQVFGDVAERPEDQCVRNESCRS